jgi:two-component system LytT family response regulator
VSAPLRVVLADDEPLARERLRTLLAREKGVTLLAECEHGQAALDAVARERPDLLLLDVQMPGMTGFDVAAALAGDPGRPLIVFVTAFDEYALAAFQAHAMDYLVKPVGIDRFREAMERVRLQLRGRSRHEIDERMAAMLERLLPDTRYPERFSVRRGQGFVLVRAADIRWVEAADNYVKLHLPDGRHEMLRASMSAMEQKLDPKRFVRIHRGVIVNLDQVRTLEPAGDGEHFVVLADGTRLGSSRTYGPRLRDLLGA